MPNITTKAIVFSAIKYSDTSLIVKCFTEKEGLKSYLIRGVLKAKKSGLKPAHFQPLTQLQITANHNNKGNLNSIKEATVSTPYNTVYTNITKQTIAMFLSEILANTIKEEEKNTALFNYLEASFIWLDTHNAVSNFHLLFLLNLSKYLGFYPDFSEQEKQGFNLIEGTFTNEINSKLVISNKSLTSFKKLLGINFDAIETVSFNKNERQNVLQTIIKYFELHLEGFKHPKSLQILETVFN